MLIANGVTFLLVALLFRDVQARLAHPGSPQTWIPRDLTRSFWIRRDGLTRARRRLLDFVERQTLPNRSVPQSELERVGIDHRSYQG